MSASDYGVITWDESESRFVFTSTVIDFVFYGTGGSDYPISLFTIDGAYTLFPMELSYSLDASSAPPLDEIAAGVLDSINKYINSGATIGENGVLDCSTILDGGDFLIFFDANNIAHLLLRVERTEGGYSVMTQYGTYDIPLS